MVGGPSTWARGLCAEAPSGTAQASGWAPAGGGSAYLPCFWLQGDQGGLRTLQKKWTTFLKARLLCGRPDGSLFFNVLRSVFVLRAPDLPEPVLYGVFTPQL